MSSILSHPRLELCMADTLPWLLTLDTQQACCSTSMEQHHCSKTMAGGDIWLAVAADEVAAEPAGSEGGPHAAPAPGAGQHCGGPLTIGLHNGTVGSGVAYPASPRSLFPPTFTPKSFSHDACMIIETLSCLPLSVRYALEHGDVFICGSQSVC